MDHEVPPRRRQLRLNNIDVSDTVVDDIGSMYSISAYLRRIGTGREGALARPS